MPLGKETPQREQMVTEQLQARGIDDARVLAAMGQIPRELFVPANLQDKSYDDMALPIDCQQTISQPLIVAMMSQALELKGTERVLEVGTGSGYQTAILSQLAAEVISIERHEDLSLTATNRLGQLGCQNVTTIVGDGTRGCPEKAPFDRIMVTAAAGETPPALLDQLADDGRLVIPLGKPLEDGKAQTLTLIHKNKGRLTRTILTGCRFVPLVADD